MAVTIAAKQLTSWEPETIRWRLAITFDTSYPTNGELVDVGAYLKKVEEVFPLGPSTTGYIAGVLPSTLDASIFALKMWYGDYSNASDGVLVEVPNGTNLSAETVYLIVAGPNMK